MEETQVTYQKDSKAFKAFKAFQIFLAVCPFALTLLSALWHFLYDMIPLPIIGAFAPVNETPFLIVWWIGYAFDYPGKNPAGHALSGIVGAVAASFTVIAFQYIVCDILKAPSVLPVHILNTFTSLSIGTILGNRFKNIGSPKSDILLIVVTLSIVAIAAGYCISAAVR